MPIYISGKISGLPINEVRQKFEKVFQSLKGTDLIVNPVNLPHKHDGSWESFMKECITHLMTCDKIYMLNDWKFSKGAVIEYELAKLLKIKVIYEAELVAS